MSLRRAQLEISSFEFVEWMAYFAIEPFGEQMADLRHGIATAVLANCNRDSKEKPEPYRAQDFIPWADAPVDNDDAESVLLDDPVAQSNLIRAAMFGIAPG